MEIQLTRDERRLAINAIFDTNVTRGLSGSLIMKLMFNRSGRIDVMETEIYILLASLLNHHDEKIGMSVKLIDKLNEVAKRYI